VSASVVVVSYRPGDWLEPCLRSVVEQADEVILVDNGSAGAGASSIGHRLGAKVLRSATNIGFARAVNLGARSASGELLALLNDDATAGPGWLRAAAEVLKWPDVAAVGPKVVLAQPYREVLLGDQTWKAPGDDRPLGRQVRSVLVDGKEALGTAEGPGIHRIEADGQGDCWRWTAGGAPWYVPVGQATSEIFIDGEPAPPGPLVRLVNTAGAFLDSRGYAGDIGFGAPDDGRFDLGAQRFALSGVAIVTRAATWHAIGPFAARFFAYYEDVDWCWRANLAGLELRYDPAATVVHRRSASSGGEHVPRVRVMAERNRTLALVRNGPPNLVAKALYDRYRNGPDGGVRAGIARRLPWALWTRATLMRRWQLSPGQVWDRWAGAEVGWGDGPAGEDAYLN